MYDNNLNYKIIIKNTMISAIISAIFSGITKYIIEFLCNKYNNTFIICLIIYFFICLFFSKQIKYLIKEYIWLKAKNLYNKVINKVQEYFVNRFVEQKKKEYGGLYNFISKEYPGVLKEYTEKEIIKHYSILDFLKAKYPEDENLKNKYKNYIKSELNGSNNCSNRDLISCYKLHYEQFSIVYVVLYCTKIWNYNYLPETYLKIAKEMLEVTEKYASYFDEYVLEMAWEKLRNMYLLKYAKLKRCENFYTEYYPYIKKIEEIFNKQREIEMKDKYEKYIYNIKEMKKYFNTIKNIIQDEYEDEYNEHTINIDGNLKKLEELKIQNENIEDYVIYIKKIREILSTQLSKLRDNNEQSEYNLKFNYILYKSCNFIQAFFEELDEYSVKLTENNYINAHKAFINNIIEDTEFYELINFGRAEYYVSYHPYDADVFLYDINIDNIDKNDIQKVFTLYQELCTDVLKIYLSGKLKEDSRIDKYMKNINKLYDIINENSNEMLKFRATKLKSLLEKLGFKVDNTLHTLPKAD